MGHTITRQTIRRRLNATCASAWLLLACMLGLCALAGTGGQTAGTPPSDGVGRMFYPRKVRLAKQAPTPVEHGLALWPTGASKPRWSYGFSPSGTGSASHGFAWREIDP